MTHDDLIEIQECQDDALLGFAEALDYNQALRDIEKELEAVPTNLAVPAPASDAVQCNADPTSRRPPMTPLHERLCEPHPRVVSIQSTLSSSRVFEFGTLRAKPDLEPWSKLLECPNARVVISDDVRVLISRCLNPSLLPYLRQCPSV